MGTHLVGDAGNLRAHCPPLGAQPDLPRITRSVVPASAPLALHHAVQSRQQGTQPPAGSGSKGANGSGRCFLQNRHDGAPGRARKNALCHLPEDAPQASHLCTGDGHLRLSCNRPQRDRLLHRAGCAAPDVQASSWQVQGSHRHCQGQRLPVAAHNLGGTVRREHRVSDAHRRNARDRRSRRGCALAIQGARWRWNLGGAPGDQMAAVPARYPE